MPRDAFDPHFFPTPAAFNAWLGKNHAKADVLWVGFWKKHTGKAGMDWGQSVEEALCYGWIDGVRRTIDADSYTNRFTPRRPGSVWSKKNIETAERLIAEGRMQPPGLAAFQAHREDRSRTYTYEQDDDGRLPAEYESELRKHQAAWEHFQERPPWYRRTVARWILSAKRPETRQRRLAQLIAFSADGKAIPLLDRG